jgi:hypothetical protein
LRGRFFRQPGEGHRALRLTQERICEQTHLKRIRAPETNQPCPTPSVNVVTEGAAYACSQRFASSLASPRKAIAMAMRTWKYLGGKKNRNLIVLVFLQLMPVHA